GCRHQNNGVTRQSEDAGGTGALYFSSAKSEDGLDARTTQTLFRVVPLRPGSCKGGGDLSSRLGVSGLDQSEKGQRASSGGIAALVQGSRPRLWRRRKLPQISGEHPQRRY